ncbi:chalcone isomerase family protein [Shewanella dokdonensis]|uniref:Chalcone isomerase family protein n=1 Tax=Shewanella dokdonensis TaxID=712036 RepID=A0ABX8DG78_9GAMM|nr:chalcone isomerase family protein [Shewanella dokdonensis]MCL1073999.1 chalcone isomerase family protein [Shewanella dokdonensis]QVK23759.1 chalcone isomerase family protein [Shewanella dokdonensis]
MKFISLSCLLLLLSLSVSAREVSGVDVPETLSLTQSPLQLNGAGVRSKFFMDLYVGSLYLPTPASTTAEVLNEATAVVSLKILSGLITSEKMRNAIKEGFDDATDGQTQPIAADIQHFTELFADEIKVGDEFLLVADKQHGVTAYKNGVAKDTITGEAFREALLNIWLGDEPAQKSLKREMLGQ